MLVVLSSVPLPYAAHAQSSPSVALSLSSASVPEGTAITATMSFVNLTEDSDRSITDYIFRADVVDANDADAGACEGYGLGVDRYMYQVDEDPEVRTGRISARCLAGDYTVIAVIASAANVELASATARFTITAPTNEPCSGGGYDPTPTAVAVTSVPIVVTSTTADYFVLYVSHDVDGAEVELPVLVKKGGDGTTALAENLAALPKERYRVEKYLVSDPADVDGDCIDDITELGDPVGMNPVNPAAAIELSKGAVAIPDRATFDALSLADSPIIKFTIFGADTYRPSVYFQNTNTYNSHFDFLPAIGIDPYMPGLLSGYLDYAPRFFAPDGSPGLYVYMLNYGQPFSLVDLSHTMLAASMPLLEDDLAYYLPNDKLPAYQHELTLYEASRINLVFDEDIAPKSDFSSLNQAEGYGFLRIMDLEESPNPRDVVIYDALPNELPRVAGIITTVPQTPLSHVNLRAVQDGVPNAYIGDAYRSHINSFAGKYVHYEVMEHTYSLRVATRAEVDAHFASSRPGKKQTPQRDLSVTEITPLSEVDFEDWKAFGVKAANVAVLGTFDFPEGTVPDGFAVPFYFYDEFMKHNGFYDDIKEMLADAGFQADLGVQESKLKKLRKAIKKGETPGWIIDALTEMNELFPEGTNRRYRSSTNNEDLPGFNGAGLYDSKTQKPKEDEEDIAKSLKQVYASLWNFRAFTEREFHRIDHLTAAMGILVHPNYSDELANGVAVSFNPLYRGIRDGWYYVNTQIGEDLVTNPDALSVPEEVLLNPAGGYFVLRTSNQKPPGQLLMSNDQLDQLRRHLAVIHKKFAELYNPGSDEDFAMEIEFKITSENVLAIKQARPWVFGPAQTVPASATLSDLTLSNVYIGTFGPATTEYTADVDNDLTETTITATVNEAGATYTVKLGGVADSDGTVSLSVGSNVITIEVTSEDEQTTKTYKVTVNRAEPLSTDATLNALELSGVSIGTFDPDATRYAASVANDVTETTVTLTKSHDGATYVIKLGGAEDGDGVIPLAVGENFIAVEVTAEDGQTTKTYAVTVTRAGASLPVTVDLSPSGPVTEGTEIAVTMTFGGLTFDTDRSTIDYTFRADVLDSEYEDADQCETQNGGYGMGVQRYMYQVDEDPETRTGTVSADCPAGDYTLRASVSSPDNVALASASTSFTVSNPPEQQQPEPASSDATLSGLALSGAPFAFDQAIESYEVSVGHEVEQTTITAETNDEAASYEVALVLSASYEDGSVGLAVGANLIVLLVTAADEETAKTYTVTVTRTAPPSTDATLSGLTLSGAPFAFDQAIENYEVSVGHEVEQTTITAETNDEAASYEVALVLSASYEDGSVGLAVGANLIVLLVTAADGETTKTYTLNVTRAEA